MLRNFQNLFAKERRKCENKRAGRCANTRPSPNRNGSSEDHVMAKKPLPSPEVLRQLLRYEPETGKLFWKERGPEWFDGRRQKAAHRAANWSSRYADKEAFTAKSHGYHVGRIFDQMFRAHRVIWAMETSAWPDGDIDHINGVRSDNRIVNLRDISSSLNNRNMRLRSNNTSGVPGVYFSRSAGKWVACAWADGTYHYLGLHETVSDAIAARKLADPMLGFHENHGRE